jgi:uncharacterized RDD family membrane protein YckC
VTSWDDTSPAAWDDPPAPAEPRYAGFWIRFVAFLIDGIVVSVVSGMVLVGTGQVEIDSGDGTPARSDGDGSGLLLLVVYFVICWAVWKRTLGYRVLGLRLVKTDGTAVTWGTAIVRGLMFIVSFVPFTLGLVWAAFNPRKQGWHDLVAGTWVIRD